MNTITIKRTKYGDSYSKLQPYSLILIRRASYHSGIPYQNILELLQDYPETPFQIELNNNNK